MTHNLEKLLLANHNAKHLKIHSDTFPCLKENLRVVWRGRFDPGISIQILRFLMNEAKNYMMLHTFFPTAHA